MRAFFYAFSIPCQSGFCDLFGKTCAFCLPFTDLPVSMGDGFVFWFNKRKNKWNNSML